MPNITKPAGLSNIWANGGTKLDPGSAKVNLGWVVQLPPYEYQNWVDNRQDQAIAHISQHGIPEWDGLTEYQGLLSYAQGSDGIIYKCLQTNTNKDPSNTLNSLFWAVAFETFGSVAAVQSALAAHILNYQTLAGIGNLAGARTNLSVYSKVESDTRFASLNGSPAQVFSVGVATQPEHAVRLGQVSSLLVQATESNLGVIRISTLGVAEGGTDDTTAITPLKGAAVYLKKTGNLAGLANIATARSNLGLGTAATQSSGSFLQTANNLSDVLSASAARINLGITSTATQPENYFLRAGQNLFDLSNISTARSNLGLGNSAVRSVGTTANTVAAGDDTRITLAVPNTRLVSAGNGLVGGGNLSGNITLQVGTPSTVNLTSTNTVTAESHTHALDLLSFFSDSLLESNGYYTLPGGFIVQWGDMGTFSSNNQTRVVTFNKPFPNECFLASPLGTAGTTSGTASTEGLCTMGTPTLTNFSVTSHWQSGTVTGGKNYWIALGR